MRWRKEPIKVTRRGPEVGANRLGIAGEDGCLIEDALLRRSGESSSRMGKSADVINWKLPSEGETTGLRGLLRVELTGP